MAISGIMGKVAVVDLTSGSVKTEKPADELYANYLGGYGLGGYYLYTRQKAGADPLGPKNHLGFFSGPLTGTPAICGNRFQVVGRSPKTLGFGDANCGGNFGPYLKFSGFDGLWFAGQSEEPVYLLLEDGKAKLHSAKDLWGLDTHVTEEKLLERHGKEAAVCSIGPAGEKGVLFSAIMTDRHRAFGRGGAGARPRSSVARPAVQPADWGSPSPSARSSPARSPSAPGPRPRV